MQNTHKYVINVCTRISLVNINTIPPGTVVGVSYDLYDHVGVIGDWDVQAERTVISASRQHGKVIEEVVTQFADGQKVRVLGYLGSIPSSAVLARARAMLGRRYRLLTWNCDHLVRYAHGLSAVSPQIWRAIGGLTVGIAAIAIMVQLIRNR